MKALLKFLDNNFGRLVCALFRPLPCCDVGKLQKILVIRPGGIGDAVLLLPMLHELALLHPDAQIDVLAENRNSEVFGWSPVVSTIWQYDCPNNFLSLFQQRYDLIIDTEQWYHLSAMVTRLLAAPRSIGFATNTRSRLFTDSRPYHQERYEAEMFLELLEPLRNGAFESTRPRAEVLVLTQAGFKCGNPYIVIFPGASVVTKQWPAERYAEVARYCEDSGFEIVIVGGKTDIRSGEVVSRTLRHFHNLVGKTTLTDSASIIAGSVLMISGDSGLLHVAQLLKIPTVAIFGPSNIKKWLREGDKHVVVSAGFTCAPCSLYGTIPKCHHGFQCMQDISVDMVITAVSCLMKKTGATIADCP